MNQHDPLTNLHSRLLAVETLLDMLWTDRFSQDDSPYDQAVAFKEQVLGLVTSSLPGESIDEDAEVLNQMSYGALEERLDAILRRVGSL